MKHFHHTSKRAKIKLNQCIKHKKCFLMESTRMACPRPLFRVVTPINSSTRSLSQSRWSKPTIMLKPRTSLQTYFSVLLCILFIKRDSFNFKSPRGSADLLQELVSSLGIFLIYLFIFSLSLSCVSCHSITDITYKATWSWSRSPLQKCFITASGAYERCGLSGDTTRHCLPWDSGLREDLSCINNQSVLLGLYVCLSVWV